MSRKRRTPVRSALAASRSAQRSGVPTGWIRSADASSVLSGMGYSFRVQY
jgi:hypothetical protein